MNKSTKILSVIGLAVAVVAVIALKNSKTPAESKETTLAPTATVGSPGATQDSPIATAKLPKLLDLGATKCIPCKKMAPILEELKKEYAGKMEVEFIDVWQNPDAARRYGIQMIPTQIFYDADGKEIFRHIGFIGKEDILAKWKELGVDLGGGKASAYILRVPGGGGCIRLCLSPFSWC
jgi:thioredoxin 1